MRNGLYQFQRYAPPEIFFWMAMLLAFFSILLPGKELPDAHGGFVAAAAIYDEPRENPYQAIELAARAAYVFDARAGKTLFAKNETEPLALASITKIMTAAVALSLIPETTYITIAPQAIKEEGDSGLVVGERWLLRDLLKFMLLESSNDAAAAVSSAIGEMLAVRALSDEDHRRLFIEKMNEEAARLGLSSTRFFNESGLDIDETHPGAVSSGKETARLLAYALLQFPAVFAETRWSELEFGNENGGRYSAQNTNKEVDTLPLLIASKTGYTDLAGGNLVIAFDAGFNYPIVISVLGSTIDERFNDVRKLVWATLEFLQQN
ncbi:MAG: hypothetical protein A2W52_02830 [Candidatus Taylorbacteria bacterium RIFCSPHIGHO2_02_49_25]|uniref:Peptidase S11 D-alanyl-D-alanine carboxypeptidase A N-terminal domain-containing protein n=1 Tax=Candidatus Taylorbacteria bacterium RIFCSPHIGHO2_02_49_25 TaxID=1802305 RepID=A0A1G2ML07_9BACT|nr:MAG: Serine-type D-Ala-D-Ala carboxypeptidase [Parcubacteria group bacterium GW2011_GWF2_50_9]OHA21065.1 MAG: hypothetical protein A2759_00055 [Candidatus Taylorbacteria bacterium RIFCSPHIGHO2_01_FULL_49_60]OHA23672.1 MAG: hypothetical protein A2W52_02830 [Candidatus Taylorbacteria bacterium RIFCSPHIGHO2_02_49_25]OHA35761.1 MAG: hypothetical protein A3B27_02330 [Candidatus Taylorbacteria bacterium RIFCSPLOWO2_01_FULL_50_130]OHA37151.1 MAG: hypothetical protein A2W65_02385 [Candidatus Taylorb